MSVLSELEAEVGPDTLKWMQAQGPAIRSGLLAQQRGITTARAHRLMQQLCRRGLVRLNWRYSSRNCLAWEICGDHAASNGTGETLAA